MPSTQNPPPHSGRPLVRLRHERINTYPHRTTPLNDNNPQTTSKCLRTHLSSATRHSSHRHSGLHPTYIMAPPKRTSATPWADQIIKDTQMSLSDAVIATQDRDHPGDHSFVMLRVLRRKQPKQVSNILPMLIIVII